jgi:hypothetical protein
MGTAQAQNFIVAAGTLGALELPDMNGGATPTSATRP